MRENRAGFERITFDPRVLVDVSALTCHDRLREKLKSDHDCPDRMTSIAWPRGEILAARAASGRAPGWRSAPYRTLRDREVRRGRGRTCRSAISDSQQRCVTKTDDWWTAPRRPW